MEREAWLSGKRVVVVGLGASGIAAAHLAYRRGARVVAVDSKDEGALSPLAHALRESGIDLTAGERALDRLSEAELVVVSPGVPALPEIIAVEKKGVPVIGEVELAVRALVHPAPIVAIGGTNGKSTTTSLVGALLERTGKRVFTGGNLGEPLAAHADETFDAIVLEVSSFQMERAPTFRPFVATLLNVTDDHLDRYPSFRDYADAKGNMFVNQTDRDHAVVPFRDDLCRAQAERGHGQIVTFGGDLSSAREGGGPTYAAAADGVRFASTFFPAEKIALRGGHNLLNVAAALATIAPFFVAEDAIASVLATCEALPHRMAFVGDVRGVHFYDDSKGTNVGASVTALVGIAEPKAVLIAGGKDKGGSYAPLAEALKNKGRACVLIGEAADVIERAVGAHVPTHRAPSMEKAVDIALELAQTGDAVLLSPACSSFDMFRDYKDRGDAFARAVRALAAREGGEKA